MARSPGYNVSDSVNPANKVTCGPPWLLQIGGWGAEVGRSELVSLVGRGGWLF